MPIRSLDSAMLAEERGGGGSGSRQAFMGGDSPIGASPGGGLGFTGARDVLESQGPFIMPAASALTAAAGDGGGGEEAVPFWAATLQALDDLSLNDPAKQPGASGLYESSAESLGIPLGY